MGFTEKSDIEEVVGFTKKTIQRGGFPKKGVPGQFANLRGWELGRKYGVLTPQCTLQAAKICYAQIYKS